ncbi:MAG: acyl-CoA reductase [Cyclobacteriaceae bacterium]|nr:acyl-CoA reductase [Cyclobacteriaceae bacterium]
MKLSERIDAFASLGTVLRALTDAERSALETKANQENGWFTPTSVRQAIHGITVLLEPGKLKSWVATYPIEKTSPRTIGVAMAGNIPLVGFHDFLCVLLCGHRLVYKPSSKDTVLLKFIQDKLLEIEPRFADRIQTQERLNGLDGIIATGSDNTSRYFEYYFRNIPHIIRKNRVSCAILQGDEPESEIHRLGEDIFTYYGLGCRNVSCVFIPHELDKQFLLERLAGFSAVMDNHKYENNYTYQKSILMLNQEKFFDNGFLLMRESDSLVSPIAVLHYQVYRDLDDLRQRIRASRQNLQVVVSAQGWFEGSLPFGTAQYPLVDDYADGVDTLKFLCSIK